MRNRHVICAFLRLTHHHTLSKRTAKEKREKTYNRFFVYTNNEIYRCNKEAGIIVANEYFSVRLPLEKIVQRTVLLFCSRTVQKFCIHILYLLFGAMGGYSASCIGPALSAHLRFVHKQICFSRGRLIAFRGRAEKHTTLSYLTVNRNSVHQYSSTTDITQSSHN